MSEIHCKIVTPESLAADANVSGVIIPVHDGLMGVLPGHAPFLCNLGVGLLRMQTGEREETLFIDGGFAHIRENEVTILTRQALGRKDISHSEALTQLADAQVMPMTTATEVEARSLAVQRAKDLVKLVE
ncbi:MAG: ATP synthase F1 subunit epsilon [Phycisphaerae bacterium]|nr:ATP synthase F1 subunit epsilon [Phycisphaerae bacterium]